MYEKAVIARSYVSKTAFERMNTRGREKGAGKGRGRGKLSECQNKVAENYIRQQRGKARRLKGLMDVNFVNDKASFVTLTFSEEPTSIEAVFHDFTLFRRRLNKKYDDLRYIAVVERGLMKRWHIHVILNLIYNPDNEANIVDSWNKGIDIDVRNVFDVIGLACYMTKDFGRFEEGLYGKKRYLVSKGLEQPIEINNWDNAEIYHRMMIYDDRLSKMPKKVVQNERAGRVEYSSYNCETHVFGECVTAKKKVLF